MAETLTFKTTRSRRTVQIDDCFLELRDMDELDLGGGVELRTVLDAAQSVKTREEGAKVTADLKAAMALLFVDTSPVQQEKIDLLSHGQRLQVVLSFLGVQDGERKP